ncbi:hypothetical protein QYF36_022720 [Acer negundo]|nr:hypothetical protein QYF36_022720 [Acer negundo]
MARILRKYSRIRHSDWRIRLPNVELSLKRPVKYSRLKTYLYGIDQSASFVGEGGEVYSENVKSSPHTNTEMGSGSFAHTRYDSACFINNMRIQDANSMQLKLPEPIQPLADQDNCYNIIYDIKGPSGNVDTSDLAKEWKLSKRDHSNSQNPKARHIESSFS